MPSSSTFFTSQSLICLSLSFGAGQVVQSGFITLADAFIQSNLHSTMWIQPKNCKNHASKTSSNMLNCFKCYIQNNKTVRSRYFIQLFIYFYQSLFAKNSYLVQFLVNVAQSQNYKLKETKAKKKTPQKQKAPQRCKAGDHFLQVSSLFSFTWRLIREIEGSSFVSTI